MAARSACGGGRDHRRLSADVRLGGGLGYDLPMTAIPDDLARLADAYGVATSYQDANRRTKTVSEDAVRLALAAMDVVAESPEEVEQALTRLEQRPWRRLVPPTTIVVAGADATVRVQVPEGGRVHATLELEDGTTHKLPAPGPVVETGTCDGRTVEAREIALPADLPLGYHGVTAVLVDGTAGGSAAAGEGLLVVAPAACPGPERVQPSWGWMLQLYALRSADSWGLGDLADLREIVRWSGQELGADFVVANPLHAAAPTLPFEPSPYYPSSRRFVNPLYLRIEDLPAYAAAPEDSRRSIDQIAAGQRDRNRTDRIDRDAAWTAKCEALELLFQTDAGDAAAAAFAAFRDARGDALTDYATFSALAERHGTPWQSWPAELQHPRNAAVAEARAALSDRVEFHSWLQWCCDVQLADAQAAAEAAGMDLGIIHDLAVGVDPGGADGWALQDDLAQEVTVGAPPDAFNQRGQDWRLPPLRPDRLAETGYAPFREMMAAVLRHAGGIRIDHVMGLFRLWWVPEGRSAADGTYVRYPAEDLLAILALEAVRADAIVVGEDLGTVADEVRIALRRAGVFSSKVLYFEQLSGLPGAEVTEGEDRRLRAEEYPAQSLASVTTHDLPTAAGWWADEAVRVQGRLDLLGEDTTLEAELDRKGVEKADLRELLVEEGVLDPDAHDPDALREAMHAFLARCGALLVAAQPADAIGDLRQPNLPGTTDEYPNWRLPVATPGTGQETSHPVLLGELKADQRVLRLAQVLQEGRAARRAAER
jgi:4-alpha-glucanotransferase